MIPQSITTIPAILSAHGIRDVIISPGSRSAPLTISMVRSEMFDCRLIPDERSAAFVGMGIALRSKRPVVLICTSGSAGLNYSPAVAEAFFQEIPLLIFTADRPPEWIDQWDGQTIRQSGMYGKHVLKSYDFPTEETSVEAQWHGNRMINEAILLCQGTPKGPVHINFPFREPFYPEPNERIDFTTKPRIIQKQKIPVQYDFTPLVKDIHQYKRVLFVAGQMAYDEQLVKIIAQVAKSYPVIADAQSNCSAIPGVITHHDLFLANQELEERLTPDLVISFGLSVISKNLKKFLRRVNQLQHWQCRDGDFYPDTFRSLSRIIPVDKEFLINFFNPIVELPGNMNFLQDWQQKNQQSHHILESALSRNEFNEFSLITYILRKLPAQCDIHVSNSMPIRYVNYWGLFSEKQELFVNRGTSGIDGSVSTAVGSALVSHKPTFLITGDMAFLYDRNGLWHNYIPDNLKIIVLNNQGGGIFGMIPGPKAQPELDDYFITDQKSDCRAVAESNRMDYYNASNWNEFIVKWTSFSTQSEASILELFTKRGDNEACLHQIRLKIKEL